MCPLWCLRTQDHRVWLHLREALKGKSEANPCGTWQQHQGTCLVKASIRLRTNRHVPLSVHESRLLKAHNYHISVSHPRCDVSLPRGHQATSPTQNMTKHNTLSTKCSSLNSIRQREAYNKRWLDTLVKRMSFVTKMGLPAAATLTNGASVKLWSQGRTTGRNLLRTPHNSFS